MYHEFFFSNRIFLFVGFKKMIVRDLKILWQSGSQVDCDYATLIGCGCSKVLFAGNVHSCQWEMSDWE